MLKIWIGKKDDEDLITAQSFHVLLEDEWFNDPRVKQIIKDIDKSDATSFRQIIYGYGLFVRKRQINPRLRLDVGLFDAYVVSIIFVISSPSRVSFFNNSTDNAFKVE